MRIVVFISLLCVLLRCDAQEEKADRKLSYGIGAHSIIGGAGGMSYSGYARVRYQKVEVGLLSGTKNRLIKDFKSYDEVTSKGTWIEPSVSLLFPSLGHYSGKVDFFESGYLKTTIGFGFVKSDNEFKEIFEGQGPFQDFIYADQYMDRKSRFLRFSLGIHGDLFQRVNMGYGFSYIHTWDADQINPSSPKMPFVLTPFNSSAPVGMYLELGVIL